LKRYPDVFSAGVRYLELSEGGSGLRGIDIVAASGEACSLCGGGPSTLIKMGPGERGHWKRICTDCREPWRGEVVELMSRWVSSTLRVSATENRLAREIDETRALRRVFEKQARKGMDGRRFAPGRWQFGMKCFFLYCHAEWGSYARVVEWGAEHERGRERDLFTHKRVRDSINRTRWVLEDRAKAEGILR
jgi:hypothetical protein